jgi:hypothetical protein
MKTKLTLSPKVKTRLRLSLKVKIIAGASLFVLVTLGILFYNVFFNNKDAAAIDGKDTPITVSGSSGANGSYTSLTNALGAFAKINTYSQTGNNIIITVTGNSLAESGINSLNAGTWNSLTIYPVSTGLTISGNIAGPLITLNGADKVTIDGRVNASGSASDLIITNTSTSNVSTTSTIRFINSAENNIVKYCTLKGAETYTGSGVILFSNASGGNGNDGNTLDSNNITSDIAGRPINAIFSSGTAGRENSGDTISNNNFYNFLNPGNSSNGIFISYASTDFTLSGNSFYETTTFTPNGAYTYNPIRISTAVNHLINANFIGGSAPQCGGSPWIVKSSFTHYFCGIYISGGTTANTTASVQNNTIANIAYSSVEDNPWDGIFINSGNVNVTGNTIGSATGTGTITLMTPVPAASANMSGGAITSINLIGGGSGYTIAPVITFSVSGSTIQATATANLTNGVVTSITLNNGGSGYTSVPSVIFDGQSNGYSTSHGMINASTGIVNISNNNIGSITTIGSDYYSHGFESIYVRSVAATTNFSNNLIGSLTTPNSIYTSSSATMSLNKQDVYGLYSSSMGTTTMSGNTIANLTNGYSGTNSASRARGISTVDGVNSIQNNTVRNISSSSAQNSVTTSAAVIGISQTSATAGMNQTISGNLVYGLTCTNSSVAVAITGILSTGPTSGINIISGNFIHSLSCSSSNTGSEMDGIVLNGGSSTCSNNIVNLGVSITAGYKIYGISDLSGTSNNNNIYFNSVYIGGTVISGTTSSTADLWNSASTSTRNYRNNILVNVRSGGNTGKHYAIYVAGTTGLTIDYNDYFVSSNMLGRIGTNDKATFTSWKSGTTQDANSLNIDPLYTNAGGTDAINYYPVSALPGISGTAVTIDYAGVTRGNTPKIGALETQDFRWKGGVSTDFATASNWLENAVPLTGANIVFDANPNRNCVLDKNRTVGNITNAQGVDKLVINGKQLTINGNLNFTNNAKIDATSALSTVVFAGPVSQNIPQGSFMSNTVNSLCINDVHGVSLNGDLTVTHILSLTNGTLSIGDNTLTVSQISGGSTLSYVITGSTYNASTPGYLKIKSVGNTPVTFPVGTATSYNPCFISNSGSGGVKDFKVRVFQGVYTNGLSGTAYINNDLATIVNRTWEITPSDQVNVDAQITLQWNTSEEGSAFSTNRPNAFVSKNRHTTGDNNWNQQISSEVTCLSANVYQITAPHITTFSTFAIGSPGSSLPVELLSFTGKSIDNKVKLNWTTSSETNNDYFSIEKSTDGITYNLLGTVKGAGNSNIKLNYEFEDIAPELGVNYYKLKQTDFDGKFEYFNIITVSIENTTAAMTASPNPFIDEIKIKYNSSVSGVVEIILYDLNGNIVKKSQQEVSKGSNVFVCSDFKTVPAGVYLLGITQDNKSTAVIKMIKAQ